MSIEKENSSNKTNLNLNKNIKEKRKEAKYQSNNWQKHINTNYHDRNIRNDNLFIKKNLFLNSNQFENQKNEDNKRYKKDPENSYLYNNKRFAYEKIENYINSIKKNKGCNITIDKIKESYSKFNSRKPSNENYIKKDNKREISKNIKKYNANISSNFSKRNSKINYKNGYENIAFSKLEKQIPNHYNENEEKKNFYNKFIFSKEKKYLEKEIKSFIEEFKNMKNINQSFINKIEKLELENYNLKENFKNAISNKDNEIYEIKKQIKELKNTIQNKSNELKNALQNKNNELDEKEKQLNELKNIFQNKLHNKDIEIYELKEKMNEDKKKSDKDNISLLKERYNNEINELKNINNEYKKENNQLKKKLKKYEIEKEKIKENNDEECLKIYGFINSGNNCYLNSSLQLLTRINEFKKEILSFQDNNEINKDNDTKGKLFFEIKKIMTEIESSNDDNLIIDPKNLKYVMGNIDAKYFRDFQEDANEFIANFISGLYKETATKARVKDVKKLEINNEEEQKIYDNFYRRYYIKKGNSFLTDIFYGIRKTRNYCKNCGETITNSFSSYNMLELPIYKLVKNNNNKTLDLIQILNEYRHEKKIEFICPKCEDKANIYTETLLYTLPKYLIISFIRTIDDEYIYNDIIYNEILELKNDYDNKNYKYILKCVIEHSGGAYSGHYTALCPKDKTNNIWYRFSDSYHRQIGNDFHSRIALILLYKSFQ